eukprot:GGOE01061530.1.p1 GENE.GGOE01061530.1~~GGOE01061530.1.p1  ORF type:complete len:330 (-),score=108.81 GGOE01061530.1:131-1120(-)
MDFYSLLGVDRNVNARDLKKAYRQKALEFHPDKNPAGEQMFKQINHAYGVLSGVKTREEYDRKLGRREGVTNPGASARRPHFVPVPVNVEDIIRKDREMAKRRADLKQAFGLDPGRSVRLQTLIRRQREELGLWPQAARGPRADVPWEEKRRLAEEVRQEELRKAQERAEAEASWEVQKELRTRRQAEDRKLRSNNSDSGSGVGSAPAQEGEKERNTESAAESRRSDFKGGPRQTNRRAQHEAHSLEDDSRSERAQQDWDVECARHVVDLQQLHRHLQMQSNVVNPPLGLDRKGLLVFLRAHRVQVELAHAKYQADVLRLENKIMEGGS